MSNSEYDTEYVDVAVIGGGPAGLSAALVLGRQQRSVALFDDGRYRNSAATESHMYLGSDGASPDDIRTRGRRELAAHTNVSVHAETVAAISRSADSGRFDIVSGHRSTSARAIVVAAGQRDAPSQIPGLAERFGDAVVHCPFCHGFETLGARIAVLSERPTIPVQPAMQALYVRTHFSDDVVLCANGDDVPDALRERLDRHGVAVVDAPVTEVSGIRGDLVVQLDGTDPLRVDVGYHVPRFEIGAEFVHDIGCETDGACILVDSAHRTSVPGVYAAGDIARIRTQDVPLTFISQAVAAGQAAALWCDQDLFAVDAGLTA
ncbi:NAD(P)/FAD-dependent oxidoreductase [Gordonia humi]|uniref:Thioredoxin reductase n=1 Tax=Gordonia humi TaxID=686429 RepID=A0A840EXA2_9ACTN|nr:NAD(P)/FAD-dependent oxidoreductase [Gordonia humi]MBB4136292.1 thioredoxin reductase [Gordonia humi]